MKNGVIHESVHEGKMTGIKSISTSPLLNPYCLNRMEDESSICYHCYAKKYVKLRKTLREHLERNTEILTKVELSGREIPVTNDLIYRFESFGDIQNNIHLKNFIAIAERNPYTTFTLWTKNIHILKSVFEDEGIKKPDNFIIVVSSPILNKELNIDLDSYPYIDKIFTVYSKQYADANKVKINCSKSCLQCQKCYRKNSDKRINELMK